MTYTITGYIRDRGFVVHTAETPRLVLAQIEELRQSGVTDIRIIDEAANKDITEQDLKNFLNASRP